MIDKEHIAEWLASLAAAANKLAGVDRSETSYSDELGEVTCYVGANDISPLKSLINSFTTGSYKWSCRILSVTNDTIAFNASIRFTDFNTPLEIKSEISYKISELDLKPQQQTGENK